MQLVWHRGDLRTHDHPALATAASTGATLGVVVLDPEILDGTSPRRRALFEQNVRALRASYEDRGGRLVVRTGHPARQLVGLIDALGSVETVHAIASYTPYGVHRDTEARAAVAEAGVGVRWHDGAYIHGPGTVRTGDDSFYSVYSPFHRRWKSMGTPDPVSAPDAIPTPDLPPGLDLGEIDGEDPDVELPEPGEAAALRALEAFVEDGLARYGDQRDRLDGSGTSRLSPYITLGVLSPRTAAARAEAAGGGTGSAGPAKWIAELCWRDFMADLLYHRPDLLDTPFRSRWSAMEWTGSDADFEAWRDGRTGVPAVDAAMRQLRETGWISNRARMVAAQFLAKNLRVDWRRGEAVFKDWLLDGDTSSNVGNWQWAAGLGVDNAPYFRVMSPVSQAEKHDADGSWIRRWAPYSEGDPSPRDPVADPKASRKAYLEAAKAVPGSDEEPPVRRPRLELATPAQLEVIDGVGPETAGTIADGLARGEELRDIPGVGPGIADAVRARFLTD